MYNKNGPKNRTAPLWGAVAQPLDSGDMRDYIRSWPDKLVSFVAHRLCDDDMDYFARELYEYICVADHDGPAFEKWRVS